MSTTRSTSGATSGGSHSRHSRTLSTGQPGAPEVLPDRGRGELLRPLPLLKFCKSATQTRGALGRAMKGPPAQRGRSGRGTLDRAMKGPPAQRGRSGSGQRWGRGWGRTTTRTPQSDQPEQHSLSSPWTSLPRALPSFPSTPDYPTHEVAGSPSGLRI